MERQVKTRSVVQKVDVVERYLFLSTNTIYEVKRASGGVYMRREEQDNTLFTGEIIQRDWFPTKQEYFDKLMEFGLVKKI